MFEEGKEKWKGEAMEAPWRKGRDRRRRREGRWPRWWFEAVYETGCVGMDAGDVDGRAFRLARFFFRKTAQTVR